MRVGAVRDGVHHLLHVVLVDGGGAPVVVLHPLCVDLGLVTFGVLSMITNLITHKSKVLLLLINHMQSELSFLYLLKKKPVCQLVQSLTLGASECPSWSPNMSGPSFSNCSSNSRTPFMSAMKVDPWLEKMSQFTKSNFISRPILT